MNDDKSLDTAKDILTYINNLFNGKKERNSRYSIRAWAKQLGYNSAAFLGQVMKGERSPNMTLLNRIKDNESLNSEEWKFLKVLYLKSLFDNPNDPIFDELMPKDKVEHYLINSEHFDLITSWQHFTILEMAKQKNFTLNVEKIKNALAFELSDNEINDSIELLIKTKQLKKDGVINPKYNDKIGKILSETPSQILKNYHLSNFNLARVALDNQKREERFFNSLTLTISKQNLGKVKDIIHEASMKILEIESAPLDDLITCQLNTQFFKLADSIDVKAP